MSMTKMFVAVLAAILVGLVLVMMYTSYVSGADRGDTLIRENACTLKGMC